MVNLTTLAPEIGAAILDDTLPNNITLLELAADPPVLWGAFILSRSSLKFNVPLPTMIMKLVIVLRPSMP